MKLHEKIHNVCVTVTRSYAAVKITTITGRQETLTGMNEDRRRMTERTRTATTSTPHAAICQLIIHVLFPYGANIQQVVNENHGQ